MVDTSTGGEMVATSSGGEMVHTSTGEEMLDNSSGEVVINPTGGIQATSPAESSGNVVEDTQTRDHQDHGQHGCLPCGLSFRDTSNLRRHVDLVHGVRQDLIPCPRPWCQAKFSILAEMRQHKVECVMVCPYPNCRKAFIRPDKYAGHQRAHEAMAGRMAD